MRSALAIDVEGATLAAWHYPGSNGAVVVMAGGAGIAKELATDRFAARFHAAGFSVLAFDYRGFGHSGGASRGVVNVRTQLDDWAAAVEAGRDLEEVDADRVGIWGASLSGGHVLRVAARDHGIAAVVAQNPLTDGLLALPNALRHETLAVALRFPIIAGWDAFRGLFARPPILVPLAGPRGTVAMLTTPDAQQAEAALDPGGRCPEAFQQIAARSVLRLAMYRPGRAAPKIRCPALFVVAEGDQSVLATPAIAAARSGGARVTRIAGGHYSAYLAEYEATVGAELNFLTQCLLRSSAATREQRD